MAFLSIIRRWALREHLSIREIARRTKLSRNTIWKYLRSGAVEPEFKVAERPSKLDRFAAKLSGWLKSEAGKSRKQRRTSKQLYDDLVSLGYTGSYGRVHYSAPPAPRVAAEMEAFLTWFNAPLATDPVIKAALAHLWFVTIHPFEDGNGRIARAIADLAFARSEGSSQRFYSMSAQIRAERNAYYDQLERTQKGGTDVTSWILWFLDCLGRAIHGADGVLAAVVAKGQFWERAAALALNERQIKVLNRLLDGFEGKMTSSKWAVIAKCSQDTANRDITALLDLGLLRKGEGGGRSTHYELVLLGSWPRLSAPSKGGSINVD